MTTPHQNLPTLSGDYDKDVQVLRQFIARLQTFPTLVFVYASSSLIGGAAGNYVIPGSGTTFQKQEDWTDIVVTYNGAIYSTTIGSRVTMFVRFLNSQAIPPVNYQTTVAFLAFSTANTRTPWGGAGLLRGVPAGIYDFSMLLQVNTSDGRTDGNDRQTVTITESIPYGLYGTT